HGGARRRTPSREPALDADTDGAERSFDAARTEQVGWCQEGPQRQGPGWSEGAGRPQALESARPGSAASAAGRAAGPTDAPDALGARGNRRWHRWDRRDRRRHRRTSLMVRRAAELPCEAAALP